MATASASGLVDALRRCRLLEPAQLDELARDLQPRFPDPKALGRELLQRGWLTPYQVNQLLQDRAASLVLGPYVLLERLGEGGMGEVFKARHQKMGRVVAIKLIRKERLANEAAVKRFHREIRTAAQLSHPNVVHALDADQVGSTHLFAMEYVAGVDLYKLVKEKGPLPVEQACDCIRQAACGLAHAHEKGMVHRDIKPHNLLLDKSGVVKILDFGLARAAADDDSSTLTQEGSMMGTLDYVAPEQARNSHGVDIRADLYSLGCTFFFLLTGKVPFPGGEALEKLYKHGFEEAPSVEQLRAGVPPGVAAVVRKLLAKKPEDRVQTPAELAALLAKGAAVPVGAVQVATRPAVPAAARLSVPLATLRDGDTSAGDSRRRLVVGGAGGALFLGLAFLGFILLLLRPGKEGPGSGHALAPTRPQETDGVIENEIRMKLKRLPAGTFRMGSPPGEIERFLTLKLPWTPADNLRAEGPLHEVTLSEPFYLGIHEVTRGEFGQFMTGNDYKIPRGASRHSPDNSWGADPEAYWGNPGFEQDDSHPIVCVNAVDALMFVRWLNRKYPPGPPLIKAGEQWRYALPTEAQWEYACRAGTRTRYSCGDSDDSLKGHANVADAAFRAKFPKTDWAQQAGPWDDGATYTTPVGKFRPNAWGLYDMHGNACEWCADPYLPGYYKDSPLRDPPGPTPNGHFVIRGGAWASVPLLCRSAVRDYNGSSMRRDTFGFRVALVRGAPRDR